MKDVSLPEPGGDLCWEFEVLPNISSGSSTRVERYVLVDVVSREVMAKLYPQAYKSELEVASAARRTVFQGKERLRAKLLRAGGMRAA